MTKTKITALVLAVLLALPLLGFMSAYAAETEGAIFTNEEFYVTDSPLSKLPATFEATVKFPADTPLSTRGGVIAGDFKDMSTACFSFEIHKNGNPRLYFIDASKKTYSFIFDQIDIYTGDWVNIAIVKDSADGFVTCYINGVEKQSIKQASPATLALKSNACIGGDNRPGNEQYFKGSIKNVTFYSDVRTPAEIKADATGTFDTDNLIGSYDVVNGERKIQDKNSKGPAFSSSNPWVEKEPVTDYAYSMAVVGDTQTLAYYYQSQFAQLYSWIADNAKAKKMEYVIGLGDITDKDTKAEWTMAKNFTKMLDGVVPYSLVRGNHDSVEMFNKYFPYADYSSKVTGTFDESMLNTYHTFNVGKIKYLMLTLDMGPSDEVLEWANKVVSDHPDYNVIVSTHVYLYHDGTTLDVNDNAAASKCGGINDGDDIWDKFVKKHKNIVLVLSGHDPYDKIVTTQTKGENGNIVTQMLIDPQHTDKTYTGAALVAMLYFSEDGSHIDVEYLSTANEKYFLEDNQFSVDIAVIEAMTAPETEAETTETTEPDTTESTAETTENIPEETDVPSEDKGETNGLSPVIYILIGAVAGSGITLLITFATKKKSK